MTEQTILINTPTSAGFEIEESTVGFLSYMQSIRITPLVFHVGNSRLLLSLAHEKQGDEGEVSIVIVGFYEHPSLGNNDKSNIYNRGIECISVWMQPSGKGYLFVVITLRLPIVKQYFDNLLQEICSKYKEAASQIKQSFENSKFLASQIDRRVVKVLHSGIAYDVLDAACQAIFVKLASDGLEFTREELTFGSVAYRLRFLSMGDVGEISIRNIGDTIVDKRSEMRFVEMGLPEIGIAKVELLKAALDAGRDFKLDESTNQAIDAYINSCKHVSGPDSQIGRRQDLWALALSKIRGAIRSERQLYLESVLFPKLFDGLVNADIGWSETKQSTVQPKYAKKGRCTNPLEDQAWTLISMQGMSVAGAFEWWYPLAGRLSRKDERKNFNEAMRRRRKKATRNAT